MTEIIRQTADSMLPSLLSFLLVTLLNHVSIRGIVHRGNARIERKIGRMMKEPIITCDMKVTLIPIPSTNFRTDRKYYWTQQNQMLGIVGHIAPVHTFVYHWMDGRLAAADRRFTTPGTQVSATFGVEDETIHQYVPLTGTSYNSGNGKINSESVAIEHSAQPGRPASDATYESSARIVAMSAAKLGKRVDDFSHIPHRSVVVTACPGDLDIARIVARAREIESGGVTVTVASAPLPPTQPHFAPFLSDLSPSQEYSDEVKRMQEFLVSQDFMSDQGQNDGYYGPITQHAVNGFQRTNGIKSDQAHFGWWYPKTRAAANSIIDRTKSA